LPRSVSETMPRRTARLIGDAHFVLIGEASHGTHEFYSERARITRRAAGRQGFDAVAIEGDWPDAYLSTASCAAWATTPSPPRRCRLPPLPDLDVAEHRCRRLRGLAACVQRLAVRRCRSRFYGLDLYSMHARWLPC